MSNDRLIYITETARDAIQGLTRTIPTSIKSDYINLLLKCGFRTVDAGSFVSPKMVPQMADTEKVISLLNTADSISKLMVLAGNVQGGHMAAAVSKVKIIGYPYSVSPTFLKRNLNITPEAAWQTMLDLKRICEDSQKELRVYVTMAFGNPYGDAWDDEVVMHEIKRLYAEGFRDLVFSDITGEGDPGTIERLTAEWITTFPEASLGIHLHTKPHHWQDKVEAAWRGGMRNFESAVGGFGGCPMTGFELLANLDTLSLVEWCTKNRIDCNVNEDSLSEAKRMALDVFI